MLSQLKKGIMNRIIKSVSFLLMSMMISVLTFAQDKGVDVDINVKKDSEWYQQPWVWIIGGAVFVLLLVALLRGGQRKEA
jgi:hypothetical protein